ncbi:signal transduction histidine kinase [Novosphingobium sp. PhB165]|uniref:sensor histidine kinase n=1 Tax=Novosphingobium sp. PhB165 TaxID=2485105 RepID=UPI00104D8B5C|nr:HAMP domain-containing sensor histidine kinase [Novosphingobium sp. PhB165]TCM20646.1 signal transduction histidine kinase [Novosphingobium sp. PhB165]
MAEQPRRSAAYRIAFVYSAAFALAILLLGIAVYFAADAEFRRARDRAISDEVTALLHEAAGGSLIAEVRERETAKATDSFGYALFDPQGRRIAGSLDTVRPEPGFGMIVFRDPEEGRDTARAKTVELPDGNRLVVAIDSETVEDINATILMLFGAAFLVVLVIGVAGALVLGSYLRRRLGAISSTARGIVGGNLDQRVPVGTHRDEFDEVALALNTMLDRIAGLMDNLRQVSSDVAHDLRTPLLRLRNQLEQVGTVEGAAAKAVEQGDELLKLFSAILRITEVEGGGLAHGFAPVDLSALAEDVGESFLPAVIDSGRSLSTRSVPGVSVLGDRELLAQALANLLDNAIVHTPPGTQITLTLETSDGQARLIVADDGPGVSPADRTRLTQRFFRSEASRTTPGNGLGLSLVAAVAAAHGGDIAIGSEPGGLRVTLTLPRVTRNS